MHAIAMHVSMCMTVCVCVHVRVCMCVHVRAYVRAKRVARGVSWLPGTPPNAGIVGGAH